MNRIDVLPIFGGIVLAILCYVLSGLVPEVARGGLLVLAGALAGWSIPRLSDLGKKAAMLVLLPAAVYLSSTGCRNVKPDQFLGAVVDCAKVNPHASAALAQVETCLISALSSNPSACLAGLVTESAFAVDEIACLVAYVAQENQSKVAAGTATDGDLAVRKAANDWLVQERISIRNSYQPAR